MTAVSDVSGRPQRQQVMVQGSNVKIIAKLLQGSVFTVLTRVDFLWGFKVSLGGECNVPTLTSREYNINC